ncbi:MAG: hypothetical protein FWD97_08365 [Defluviitaleaceae bacterium]|nr:hypothetical protein [Defluviitaleaceae bacterium]
MSGKIMIQYEAVYAKTAELRSRIENELREMDTCYRQLNPAMQSMDSKTNAVFMETMAENKRKAEVTAEALHKLLMFMEISARQVEHDELILKGTFSMASGAVFGASAGSRGSSDSEAPTETSAENSAETSSES